MASIKKFKNGKIKIQLDNVDKRYLTQNKDDIEKYGHIGDLELIYHDDMCIEDLYLTQINGYTYLIDYNTSLVYEWIDYKLNGAPIQYSITQPQNPIKHLIDSLIESDSHSVYLHPLSKSLSKDLLQDLENGY